MMLRTQIILDQATHEAIRSLAFRRHQSMSETIRGILRESLGMRMAQEGTRRRFSFIGAAASRKKDRASERHDEILGEGRW